MLGAGAAELQATIKLELDWVKCPAISGISHCQVIKWGQDTCSSASVRCLVPWQRRSDLFSCHGFMMEINLEMPFFVPGPMAERRQSLFLPFAIHFKCFCGSISKSRETPLLSLMLE